MSSSSIILSTESNIRHLSECTVVLKARIEYIILREDFAMPEKQLLTQESDGKETVERQYILGDSWRNHGAERIAMLARGRDQEAGSQGIPE